MTSRLSVDPESGRIVLDLAAPTARELVAALTNVVQGYREAEDLSVLDQLASRLVALLPPVE